MTGGQWEMTRLETDAGPPDIWHNTPMRTWPFVPLLLLAFLGLVAFVVSRKMASPDPPAPVDDTDTAVYTYEISVVATGLEVPWDIAVTPDNRLLVTERPGRLLALEGDGEVHTIATLSQVAHLGEGGLMGIALHPDFATNGFLYLYYTYREAGQILNRVARFRLEGDRLTEESFIVTAMPGGSIHNGGRLRFGPDGKLYIVTGDAAQPSLARDPNSPAGKMLRVNDDGSVPGDNPTPGSPVYSLGHRNPQGLDWHPLTHELIITEHGETAHDEINLIRPGGNYGWPEVKRCFSDDPSFVNPILCSGVETWAPSGGAFIGGEPRRLRHSFFFAGLRGTSLERIEIVAGRVAARETVIAGSYGRLRAVTAGRDGTLYVSTSNRDGRGRPAPDDDKILRVTPQLVE
jgi:glucose/arabinose dehydrogenase